MTGGWGVGGGGWECAGCRRTVGDRESERNVCFGKLILVEGEGSTRQREDDLDVDGEILDINIQILDINIQILDINIQILDVNIQILDVDCENLDVDLEIFEVDTDILDDGRTISTMPMDRFGGNVAE